MVSPIGRVCSTHLFILSLTIVLGTSSLVANNSFSSRVWAYENPDSYVSTLPSNIVPIKDNKKNDKECEPGVGKLKKDQNLDELCNPGLENLKSKDTDESTSQKKQYDGNDEKKNDDDGDEVVMKFLLQCFFFSHSFHFQLLHALQYLSISLHFHHLSLHSLPPVS